MARFANRNGRVGTIGHVKTEGMQGVSEVVGFEPMAREDAELFFRLVSYRYRPCPGGDFRGACPCQRVPLADGVACLGGGTKQAPTDRA